MGRSMIIDRSVDPTLFNLKNLDEIKQFRESVERRAGELPAWKSRHGTVATFAQMSLEHRSMLASLGEDRTMVAFTTLPSAYPPCTTALDEVRPIMIRDLRLETHHRGTFILVRGVTTPYRNTPSEITTVAEDEHSDVVQVQLFLQEIEGVRSAENISGEGIVLPIKEPYLCLSHEGEYALRIDHVSDVIRLGPNNPRRPEVWRRRLGDAHQTVAALKTKGNASVKAGQYWQAIEEYSDALSREPTPEQIEIIKRNRALAFLNTQQYEAALADVGFPNFGPDPNEKALFRAAQSLYCLGRFKECLEVAARLVVAFRNNTEASVLLKRARRRCAEQKTGLYDFASLEKEASERAEKGQPPQLDHATYIRPVEVRNTEKKGRGLFVTKAVEVGDLLMCEKAFAHAWEVEWSKMRSPRSCLVNLEPAYSHSGPQAEILRMIVQKLQPNPSLVPVFNDLHHGAFESASITMVDGRPVVDTCINTVSYTYIGDMIMVRAAKDMDSGTEITIKHKETREGDVDKRMASWGFLCDCGICEDERATDATVMSHRQAVNAELGTMLTGPRPLNGADEVPRVLLWDPCYQLASTFFKQEKYRECLPAVAKTLASLGFVVRGLSSSSPDGHFTIKKWGCITVHVIPLFIWTRNAFAYMVHLKDAGNIYRVISAAVGERQLLSAAQLSWLRLWLRMMSRPKLWELGSEDVAEQMGMQVFNCVLFYLCCCCSLCL
ncbi:hypothetical protein M011DRAFT_457853 [Sporormia fimetaria CBS 119925]|uniref:Uncharacterized protein n=1 Tax=Sporormia fimetaria CBS 119925 TaxID=1340428 RepID=A0A6A6VEC6_9PLEO|nr:hypothetical protein M011DRAFT_457853 [Sporormia fimetaria CBS 119925]